MNLFQIKRKKFNNNNKISLKKLYKKRKMKIVNF